MVITDRYREISGTNISGLELIEDSLVLTATSQSGEVKELTSSDFDLSKQRETTSGENPIEYESGFQIKLKGNYAKTADKITVRFKTTFDMTTQIALGSAKTRFSNSAFVDYEIDGNSYRKPLKQIHGWTLLGP